MEKALTDRLLKFFDKIGWGGDVGLEDLKETTLFTLKTLGATHDIDTITTAIAVAKIHLVE